MKTISRYIMTLALLLTAVTGAWAQSYEAKVFDVPASWAEDETKLSAADLPKDFVQITNDEAKALAVPDGNVLLIYGFEGKNIKLMIFINGTLANEDEAPEVRSMIRMYQTDGNTIICYTAPGGPKVAWNAATKTGTFAMPGSDVVLTPIYAKAAAFATTGTEPEVKTLLPEAAEGVIAGTDASLIAEGTGIVAFAGTSTEVTQGTLMYAIGTSATEAPALTAFSATVPTAKDVADDGGNVYVWYYIQGADAPDGVAATLDNTFNDTEPACLTVTIAAEPTYAVTLAEGTDPNEWTASPAADVKKGQTVTITYAGTKSVKSVTAKRKTATTGNITVYFTDAQDYGDVHVYYWSDGPEWPGTPMTEVGTNEYSQKIYKAVIPATAEGIIFNGNGSQTADITENIADGSWWYATDQFNGLHQNEAGYNDKYTENIEVTNVDDNKWTFTMPDCNVELDIEYNVTYPVTISDGDVDATNWSATPTEQSVGQNVTLKYTGRKKIKRITIEAASTARTAAEATAEDIGKLIGADGNIYDDAAAATAASTTAVAVIAYVGSDTYDATFKNGLAIALADEGEMDWSTAMSTCEGKTAITGAKWCLPSQDQWKQMFKANGGNEDSYTGLNTTITNAGGTTLLEDDVAYWSSSEYAPGVGAYIVFLSGGNAGWYEGDEGFDSIVRACLAF